MSQFRPIVRDLRGAVIQSGNTLAGSAAYMGNLDRGQDVIYPKFFQRMLAGFLASGFISQGHDWYEAVAMPKVAEEKGVELYTECEFHGTPKAMNLKQIVEERLQNGLSVGLSVGFSVSEGQKWFSSGIELLKHAEENRYSLDDFDVKTISRHSGFCRGLIEGDELYEYGIVTVPMNPRAVASNLKGLLDDGPPTGLRLRDHFDCALTAIEVLTERLEELKSTREDQGRTDSLNKYHVDHVRALGSRLDLLLEKATSLLEKGDVVEEEIETSTQVKPIELLTLQARHAQLNKLAMEVA